MGANMIAELRELQGREVPHEEAREELERLLGDSRFRVTDRQKAILRYLAECRFKGCDEHVKAYSLALDVMGKTIDFDASNDPIVRIEVSRLRSALASYYEAFGVAAQASIIIPKGSYITLFPSKLKLEGYDDESASQPEIPENHRHPSDQAARAASLSRFSGAGSVRMASIAAAAVGMGAASVALAGWLKGAPSMTEKPVVLLSMEVADARTHGEASLVRDTLLTALTQFKTVNVASGSLDGRASSTTAGRRYNVTLKYYETPSDRSVWWQVVDGQTETVLRSGTEAVDATGKSLLSTRGEIAGRIAWRLASLKGIINTIETRSDPDDVLGNSCVIRAELALDAGNRRDLGKARVCLEATLAAVPEDVDAKAVLSRVMLTGKEASQDPVLRLKALELAKRAETSAPLSDRAQIALMVALFANGSLEAALRAGNRALQLNPRNDDAAAKLALVLYLGGYRDAGVAMSQGLDRDTDVIPADAMLVLALDAYRKGDYSRASLLSEQINGTDRLVAMLRTAALGQLKSPNASARFVDYVTGKPSPNVSYRNGVPWWLLQDAITEELSDGLAKAGLRPDEIHYDQLAQR